MKKILICLIAVLCLTGCGIAGGSKNSFDDLSTIIYGENKIKLFSNVQSTNLELNVSKGIIMVNNKVMDLSKNEIKILYFLLKRKGSIVSRDEIINYLWDNEAYVDDNTLTVNINRLRNKLNNMGTNDIIKTKRGIGYIIL